MKRRIFILIIIILVVCAAVLYALALRLPIVSGYAAKNLCSCVFVGERDANDVLSKDLNFSFIKYAKSNIDYENMKVTSRIIGLAKQTAIYLDGFGCILVKDFSEEEIRSRQQFYLHNDVINTDSMNWPDGDKLVIKIPGGVDSIALFAAIDEITADTTGTQALLIVYKDKVIAEWYAEGIDKNTKLIGWSMAKSIINALTARMARQGLIDIYEPLDIEEWKKDERAQITLNNLLQMKSGLKWKEEYFDLSDVTRMLYKKGDMYKLAISKPSEVPADSVWLYSSGTSNIISGYFRKVFDNDSVYYNYPKQELFNKIGMRNTVFETDASGTFAGSSYCWSTARDWARFGLLYLHDGVWQGDTLFPEDWVKYTKTPVLASDNNYGAHFWLNESIKTEDIPEDLFMCKGFKGQRVFIIPSKDLVIVRLGSSNKKVNMNKFLLNIINSI